MMANEKVYFWSPGFSTINLIKKKQEGKEGRREEKKQNDTTLLIYLCFQTIIMPVFLFYLA
jgi:hypothetical protein